MRAVVLVVLCVGSVASAPAKDTNALVEVGAAAKLGEDTMVQWNSLNPNPPYQGLCLGATPSMKPHNTKAECQSKCIEDMANCKAIEWFDEHAMCKHFPTIPTSYYTADNVSPHEYVCLTYSVVPIPAAGSIAGDNHFYQLGLGTSIGSQNSFQQFPNPPEAFDAFAAGAYHSIFLRGDDVWVAGTNHDGQLGLGHFINQATMTQLDLEGVAIKAVAAGGKHTLLLTKTGGEVLSFGSNEYGQLCRGDASGSSSSPQRIPGLTGVQGIAAGWGHSVFHNSANGVTVCGRNAEGELGLGDRVNRLEPTAIASGTISGVSKVVAGAKHTVVVKSDNSLVAFGSNLHGQLGTATDLSESTVPVSMNIQIVPRDVCAGAYHTVVAGDVSGAVAVGFNYYGQLGVQVTGNNEHDRKDVRAFTPIVGINKLIDHVACGNHHTMFLTHDKEVYATGSNYNGQLGLGTFQDARMPTKVNFAGGLLIERLGAGADITVVRSAA